VEGVRGTRYGGNDFVRNLDAMLRLESVLYDPICRCGRKAENAGER
jgi:hypothetical protein